MEKIVIFGSFVVDLMTRSDRLPNPGETVKGSLFKIGPGGKGFNQGTAAYKAGADVTMITKLGKDNFAYIALDAMSEMGMSKELVFQSDEYHTGIALILVDEISGQNEIVVVPGACSHITHEEIISAESTIKEAKYILLQLEINQDANELIAEMAYENGTKVIVNTAPYSVLSDEFLSKVYMITPNESEIEKLTGIKIKDLKSAELASNKILEKGVKCVVITLGSKGAFVSYKGEQRLISGYEVDVIDTTGAGDAFNGGLITALAEGKSIWDAVEFANVVGALSVQKIGTTPSMPNRNEIDDFIMNQIKF